jgi:hypothetical protein
MSYTHGRTTLWAYLEQRYDQQVPLSMELYPEHELLLLGRLPCIYVWRTNELSYGDT